jgi:hypothetical protein
VPHAAAPAVVSYAFLWEPLAALAVVGILVLLLRWAFGRGRSVVAGPGRTGRPDEYGLLVTVAEPGTFVEAEMLRRRLLDHGVRATLAPTTEGPRVLVFPADERTARALLRSAPG